MDRGPGVCGNDLVAPRAEVEERILGALRSEILTPDVIGYVIEEALGLTRRELGADDSEGDRGRLAALDAEIENATRLAVRTGQVEGVVRVLAELEADRRALLGRIAGPRPAFPSAVDLRRRVERWAADARAAFEGSPEDCRAGFLGLLGGRRMRIGPDPERVFRVEGIFELPWNENAPPESVDSRGGVTGSGGGI